jgi:hypothetical protein
MSGIGMAALAGGMFLALSGAAVAAQGMDWSTLPEPNHLRQVLDVEAFLGRAVPAKRYVQVGAFRQHSYAVDQTDQIKGHGLRAVIGRERDLFIVMMPETESNTAEVLAGWARRSGFKGAYIREIRYK